MIEGPAKLDILKTLNWMIKLNSKNIIAITIGKQNIGIYSNSSLENIIFLVYYVVIKYLKKSIKYGVR